MLGRPVRCVVRYHLVGLGGFPCLEIPERLSGVILGKAEIRNLDFIRQGFLEGREGRPLQAGLGAPGCFDREFLELFRELQGSFQRLVYELSQEPDLQGLFCPDEPARDHQFLGSQQPNHLRESERDAPSDRMAQGAFREFEFGIGTSDDEVSSQRNLGASADSIALYGGDDQLISAGCEAGDVLESLERQFQFSRRSGFGRQRLLEILARAEGSIPCPMQDDDSDTRVVVGVLEVRDELLEQGCVDGIERLGSIERQLEDGR